MTEQSLADVGVTGLAVMGRNLARNLARHGHVVALHNRSAERTRSLVAEHGDEGKFVPSESMADFVASLRRPRAIIVMVRAGAGTDAVITELVPLPVAPEMLHVMVSAVSVNTKLVPEVATEILLFTPAPAA